MNCNKNEIGEPPGWMLDDNAHRDPELSAGYTEHRDHFAEQILLSAGLHARRMGPMGTGTEFQSSSSSQDGNSNSGSGFLAFEDWWNYPKLCSGQFCKQEFLKRACKTGNGLPYYVPHSKAVERKSGSKRYGYGNFTSELRRAREALPPEIEARVENFDVDKLEWFAIFISVENWASRSSQDKIQQETEGSLDIPVWESDSGDGVESIAVDAGNDIPIENLKKQLGFFKNSNFILEQSKLPFLRGITTANLWGNRNVLEVSCHIDNWIALCAGEQASYMTKHIPWMERNSSSEHAFSQQSPSRRSESERANDNVNEKVQEFADFEKYRYMCQMAIVRPEYLHFEKSTSFLGCSMEMLRSSLARWVQIHEDCDEPDWKPPLCGMDKRKRFEISPDLAARLQSLRTVSDASARFVKMRILWELQNHFQKHHLENGADPTSLEGIALCILSFPALHMEIRESANIAEAPKVVQRRAETVVNVQPGCKEPFRVQNYEYVIRASRGAQQLQLILSFAEKTEESNVMTSIHLCEIEDTHAAYFDWEAWRDSFYCSLEACRQWKEELDMPSISLIPTMELITFGIRKISTSSAASVPQNYTGANVSVWKGWRPHCSSICKYEIGTEGFILQPSQGKGVPLRMKMDDDIYFTQTVPQQVWVPVDYAKARAGSLKNASLVVQDVLKGLIGRHRHGEEQSTLEQAETILADNSDTSASTALRVLEDLAVSNGNTAGIEKAIEILLRGKKRELIVRGAELLERFYGTHRAGETERNDGNEASFFVDNKTVKAVLPLFEQIFKASDYDDFVYEKYILFLRFMAHCGSARASQHLFRVSYQSITFSCYAKGVAQLAQSVFQTCVSFNSESAFEEFAVLVLACSNIETACSNIETVGFTRYNASVRLAGAIRSIAMREGGMAVLETLGLSPQRPVHIYERIIREEPYLTDTLIILGRILERGGYGIEPDIPRAARLYRRAIGRGSPWGVSRLALLLCKGGEGVEQDVRRALELLNRSINEDGNVFAMNGLALLLHEGKNGVQKDLSQAIQLYSRAIEEGNDTYAMCNLAILLSSGEKGVERDVPRAVELFQRSISAGRSARAMNRLALLLHQGENEVEKDLPRANELYARAIAAGSNTDTMNNLAVLLLSESEGDEQNVVRAVELLNRSINEGGNVHAMVTLADLHSAGRGGVEQDISRAMDLYQRAVDEGQWTCAMYKFAYLLETGEHGVPKDLPRAIGLYERAIADSIMNFGNMIAQGAEGAAKAVEMLANILHVGGEDVSKNVPRAVTLYSRAIAECGSIVAMKALARILESGDDGVAADEERAGELNDRIALESND